ncbi:oxidoreductase [Tannockella kyphosi]|uniref:oxidoreductase n=1 Tax=Tannockella kyphosi TaxID=2899121 RepID=UPI0020134CBE|nr:FAD-dependent oxidoreductase [Tannockella kyphosi]
MNKDYEILFTPAKIGNCEIKNRFVMEPMEPTKILDWTMTNNGFHTESRQLILNRAKDGVGLIIPGAASTHSLMTKEFLGDHPEVFEGLQEFMDEVHSYGSKLFVQLAAGFGRNFPYPVDMQILSFIPDLESSISTADAGLPNRWIPEHLSTQMSVETIHKIVDGFANAAYLCKINGVDGIDVHAVHEGYVMDQFATSHTNHRTDEYGGSLENRLRFACDVVKAIKLKCGDDFPVMLRYSVETKTKDFGKGIIPADQDSIEIGRTMEESKEAIRILSEAGYDAFNADNGTYDSWYYAHPPVYMPPNCNLKETMEIKPYTDKPVICAGRMELKQAAEAIEGGNLDFVGIARQFLTDENYLTKIREDIEEDIRPCISCHTGCLAFSLWKDSGATGHIAGNCALNPYTNNEEKYELKITKDPKHFAVVGGGIAGMEFALQALRHGHSVDLYEKSDRLGGVFNEAACFSFKGKARELLKYYECQIKKSSVHLHMATEITDTCSLEADEIIIATGSLEPRSIQVPGSEYAMNAVEFLANGMDCGQNVVIIGGGETACELAYDLAMLGKKPVIIEQQDDIMKAPGSSMANTSYLRDAFEYYKVPVYLSANVLSIEENAVVVKTETGQEIKIAADNTVVSIGFISGTKIKTETKSNVHILGDAHKVSNLLDAVKQVNDLILEF